MSVKTFHFSRDYFLRNATDYDCLQDLFQNWGDEALGIRLALPMLEWLHTGLVPWTLQRNEGIDIDDVASISIIPQAMDTFKVILRNEGVILKRDKMLEMGYSTKRNSNAIVGCKGVGVKNSMGAWVARHENETRFPIVGKTGEYRWLPQFTKTGGIFTIQQKREPSYIDAFEWTIKCVKRIDLEKLLNTVLWLNPPHSEEILFENAKGQIFKQNSRHAGRVYINHYLVQTRDLQCGVNIFPIDKNAIRLTLDRKNIQHDCLPSLVNHIADLWNDYFDKKPESISALYQILNDGKSCMEAGMGHKFGPKLLKEFRSLHGDLAYPVTRNMKETVQSQLGNLFEPIVIHSSLCDLLVAEIGSPNDLLVVAMKNARELHKNSFSLSNYWEKLLELTDSCDSWAIKDVDKKYPFLVKDGEDWIFNGSYFGGKHDDICVDGEECREMDWCKMAYLIEHLAKEVTIPLRTVFKSIHDLKKRQSLSDDELSDWEDSGSESDSEGSTTSDKIKSEVEEEEDTTQSKDKQMVGNGLGSASSQPIDPKSTINVQGEGRFGKKRDREVLLADLLEEEMRICKRRILESWNSLSERANDS